jgi:hypothetical protein
MTAVPRFRGFAGTTNAGTATINVAVPTDSTAPVIGDEMTIALIFTSASSVSTVPAGWTTVLTATAMGTRYLGVYRKVRASGDSNTATFTLNTTGAASAYLFYGAAVFGGLAGSYLRTSTGNVQTTPGVTTTVANSLAISIQGEATAATESYDNISVASPFVKHSWYIQTGSNPINSVLLATRDMATPGATGDAVSTWLKSDGTANSSGNRGSVMIVWEPVPDAEPAPVTLIDGKAADGTGSIVAVKMKAWDGAKDVGIARVEVVHGGTFVPELDRTTRVWTMGHRGGSLDYQEHSARGYVQSAIAHVDVLEFSLGRTSDGVFFGLHDATLNRTTSGLASGYTASAHTWAEISALVQDLPNRGDTRFGSQPYLRLEDFIAQWSGSHTLMFDPKLINTAGRQALYPILQQIPRYQERVLGKFFHTGTAIADEFHAIGCKAWGYAYEEAVTGIRSDGQPTTDPLYSATMGKWDYLGLDYGASEAAWAQLVQMAGSKKIIGHIVGTAAQAKQAVDRGARALQVSGVNAVSTVY